ncbi:MAG: hypothetical protein ACREDL_11310 [Bradyrhizobium sp.]
MDHAVTILGRSIGHNVSDAAGRGLSHRISHARRRIHQQFACGDYLFRIKGLPDFPQI